ncbi:MAG TPA: FMN-binding protein [Candidatus Acidoferrales bacterium]|nr:FMN-binding protein [Candidatus Acidoferrales bacterium]
MRKILLSAIVIVSFITYALYFRSKGVAPTPVIAPKTLQSSKISTIPTATPVPTDTPVPPSPTTSLAHPTTVVQQPTATPQPIIPTATPKPSSQYKDGTFTGSVADAFYGNIQVQTTISGGKITNIQFLQYPNDNGTSQSINQQADPMLAQEAIQTQSANVDIISGATDSSQAFMQSMAAALSQAKS